MHSCLSPSCGFWSTWCAAPRTGPDADSSYPRELHPYLAVVLRENDCPALEVGGVEDHVHLFFGLSRTVAVAKVVEAVKTSSSEWIKTKGPESAGFHWQGGYEAFSVGQSGADAVVRYIRDQEIHHRRVTFQEELRRTLERYQVAYDERYLWE